MSWDYSELSSRAKLAGGPKNFVLDLENYNYQKGLKAGRTQQVLFDMVILGLVTGGYALYKVFGKKLRQTKEKQVTKAQAEEAREELISGMMDVGKEEGPSNLLEDPKDHEGADQNGEGP